MSDYNSDFLKRYPCRFAGYGFGIAEALRGPVSYLVLRNLNIIASGFVFARTVYTPFLVSKRTQSPVKIVMWTGDTFLYEIIASGGLPVFFASVAKTLTSKVLPSLRLSGTTRLWTPALVGVAILPIVVPISDGGLDMIMNATIRLLYR